ncbi:putative O-glycosylation ligase, exosortase A system-associated [Sphingomonas baiyangensis]|uniref:Putative O-glycosylation ligase, exosortase A system-associated n=1 Tax=Sphingomonas baiyangensis TaxID=2572576 RepID=A0A4U1L3Q5_9SPHN|nr:putative O-glycosylation ligase, exosortase A system-associated [Sphingomonas baiyangensis]TKD51352.1 putative O-glycosylation ligase, exosortase A system-associated [Sphingomonas baiyangensis]
MRDLAFVAFLAMLLGLGLRKPFVLVLGYVYIDLVSPQRLSYYLLSSIPISLLFFAAAVIGWLLFDKKEATRLSIRQVLMLLILGWAAYTLPASHFPIEAAQKWDWVWKTLVFAIFLPFTLTTRLRMEGLVAFMVLAAGSIIITGGIKTLGSGGGYGVLNLGVSNNAGLYEGSTISAVAIAMIPLILFLMKHQTLFPHDWRLKLFGSALIFACLLIPVGTEARTGLVCIAVLILLLLRDAKRRLLWLGLMGAAGALAVPFLPDSFTKRMDTIQSYEQDQSASTRVLVWQWTWDFVQDNPNGGGFAAYLQNRLQVQTTIRPEPGAPVQAPETIQAVDAGRAWHSSYFEVLGELGWPGFILWMSLNIAGLLRTEMLRWRHRRGPEETRWIADLATALQIAHVIYLVGSLFLSLAFQSFFYMWFGVQIALDTYAARKRRAVAAVPWRTQAVAG